MAARLNQRVVAFGCADKSLRESWDENRKKDVANFPSPFRMLMLGPPNSGKSTLAKNLVVHQDPPFDEVYVCHEDAGATREYDDLEPTAMLGEIPGLDFWDSLPTTEEDPETGEERPIKRLVIVDDIEYVSANKQRLKDLAILMRFASSHKNLSVIVSHQSFFDLPVIAKKVADVFVVWRPRAKNELALIENRTGLPSGALTAIFDKYGRDARDSVCVDATRGSPMPLRWNIWTPLPCLTGLAS